MVTRFFTKNFTRELWKESTSHMSLKRRMEYFQNHLVSSLTYLEECQRRYMKLTSRSETNDVPPFFMEYSQFSNLSNGIHYLTKYPEHIDNTEKLLLKLKRTEVDEEDALQYQNASSALNGNSLPSLLYNRRINPHKHPLSDEQLDDISIKNLAALTQMDTPESGQAYLEQMKHKHPEQQFGAMAFLHEHGYPPLLSKQTIESLFSEAPPEIENTNNVSQEFKDTAKLLADPYYLPKRKELYPAFPWLNPEWKAPTNPIPPPPFYPATWFYFVENFPHMIYELWTDEYISALAAYIGRRSNLNGEKPYKIVEIGAGDGRLTHFLRQKLEELGTRNIDIIATDTGSWEADEWLPVSKVNDSEFALKKYNPQMVICSWMIPETDLTRAFRKHPTVEEYILIGPPNGDVAGKAWLTWGYDSDKLKAAEISLYQKEGFKRYDLNYLSLFQIAQNYGPYFQFCSRTVSFRRQNAAKEE